LSAEPFTAKAVDLILVDARTWCALLRVVAEVNTLSDADEEEKLVAVLH